MKRDNSLSYRETGILFFVFRRNTSVPNSAAIAPQRKVPLLSYPTLHLSSLSFFLVYINVRTKSIIVELRKFVVVFDYHILYKLNGDYSH